MSFRPRHPAPRLVRLRPFGAAALTAALLVCVGVARAEPMYVIEQLVVGVNSEPGGEGERLASIRSGDRVEVVERNGDHARVRLPSGIEGWVRASYLSRELPLRQRLDERTRELEELRAQLGRLQSELADARAANRTETAPVAAAAELGSAQPPIIGSGAPKRTLSWGWIVTVAVLALVAGFVLGWKALDRRIRRKYGGLKIY
jgi:SH3 domain protein